MQYLLFNKDVYYLTQGFGKNSYSHKYRLALDFSSTKGNKKIYAPFDCYVGKKYVKKGSAYTVWLVSKNKVLSADGKMYYAVLMVTHPEKIKNLKLNQIFKQGDYILDDGKTGNATGNHMDIELAIYKSKKDIKISWYKVKDAYSLTNRVNPCKYMVLKDNTKVYKYQYLNKNFDMIYQKDIFKPGYYKTLYNMNIRNNYNTKSNVIKVIKKNTKIYINDIFYLNSNNIWGKTTEGYINIINKEDLNCTYY